MKKAILICLLLIFSKVGFSQKYYMGIGARVGKFHSGFSFKYFVNTNNATGFQLEAMYANIASGGGVIKGFVIKQLPFKIPIIQLPLDFIAGVGAHAGYFPKNVRGYYKTVNGDASYYTNSVVSIGVDLTVQLEYKIPRVPITFTIDVVPFYEFVNRGPEVIDFGATLRYVFK